MNIVELLLTEFDQEAQTTRKLLALIPEEKFDWAPHEKSTKMKDLAAHIADIPRWIKMGLETEELDFATAPYEPAPIESTADILEIFEKSYAEGRKSLTQAKDEHLTGRWVLRTAEQIHATMTKYEIIRHAFSQVTHHRAQLGVYLRLLNIPLPGSYGPTADDPNF